MTAFISVVITSATTIHFPDIDSLPAIFQSLALKLALHRQDDEPSSEAIRAATPTLDCFEGSLSLDAFAPLGSGSLRAHAQTISSGNCHLQFRAVASSLFWRKNRQDALLPDDHIWRRQIGPWPHPIPLSSSRHGR